LIFKKSSNIEFHDNPCSGSQDRHDKMKLTVTLAILRTHLKTTFQDQAFTYILQLRRDHFTMPLLLTATPIYIPLGRFIILWIKKMHNAALFSTGEL
jgi:hypothetical protein